MLSPVKLVIADCLFSLYHSVLYDLDPPEPQDGANARALDVWSRKAASGGFAGVVHGRRGVFRPYMTGRMEAHMEPQGNRRCDSSKQPIARRPEPRPLDRMGRVRAHNDRTAIPGNPQLIADAVKMPCVLWLQRHYRKPSGIVQDERCDAPLYQLSPLSIIAKSIEAIDVRMAHILQLSN